MNEGKNQFKYATRVKIMVTLFTIIYTCSLGSIKKKSVVLVEQLTSMRRFGKKCIDCTFQGQ